MSALDLICIAAREDGISEDMLDLLVEHELDDLDVSEGDCDDCRFQLETPMSDAAVL